MSTFSLIGSAPIRLLQGLPDEKNDAEKDDAEKDDAEKYDEHKIQMALNLFLQPPPAKLAPSRGKTQDRQISRTMLWVWQCPAMLMSYSWVFCKQRTGYIPSPR